MKRIYFNSFFLLLILFSIIWAKDSLLLNKLDFVYDQIFSMRTQNIDTLHCLYDDQDEYFSLINKLRMPAVFYINLFKNKSVIHNLTVTRDSTYLTHTKDKFLNFLESKNYPKWIKKTLDKNNKSLGFIHRLFYGYPNKSEIGAIKYFKEIGDTLLFISDQYGVIDSLYYKINPFESWLIRDGEIYNRTFYKKFDDKYIFNKTKIFMEHYPDSKLKLLEYDFKYSEQYPIILNRIDQTLYFKNGEVMKSYVIFKNCHQ